MASYLIYEIYIYIYNLLLTFISRYVLGGGALCMELLTKQVNTNASSQYRSATNNSEVCPFSVERHLTVVALIPYVE